MAVVEHRFRTMASAAHVVLVGPEAGMTNLAEQRLAALEQRWSRFLPGSDVTRLAHARGVPVVVSSDTITLIVAMQRAHRATEGRFDPTMLREIVATGYAVSIEDSQRRSATFDLPPQGASIADVEIDVRSDLVTFPAGLAVDPGGLGKGLAADVVAAELRTGGAAGVLVNIGGDLAAVGQAPTPPGWVITIEDPFEPDRPLFHVALSEGGVATSSTLSRRWTQRGRSRHHLIDPRTRTTSRTDLAAVTVVAPTAWLAEAHATAALLEGSDGAIPYLDSHGLSGLCTTLDGSHRATTDLGDAVAGAAAS